MASAVFSGLRETRCKTQPVDEATSTEQQMVSGLSHRREQNLWPDNSVH